MNFLPFAHDENLSATPTPPTTDASNRAAVIPFIADEHLRINKQPAQDAESFHAFDAEAALARVDGDRELLRPMVQMFALQWSKLGEEIVRAGRHRDGAVLELTAHRLKISVASFGAHAASSVARELEVRGRNGGFHGVEKICARLNTEVSRLVNDLTEFSDEKKNTGQARR